MTVRRPSSDRPVPVPQCWNCGADPGGRRVVTIKEASRICRVSTNSIYRWMEKSLIEWIYIAGGQRRIYRDTLTVLPAGGRGRNDACD